MPPYISLLDDSITLKSTRKSTLKITDDHGLEGALSPPLSFPMNFVDTVLYLTCRLPSQPRTKIGN